MKKIELSQGKVALVDDEDYERVSQYKWKAWWNGYNWYAIRSTSVMIFMHRVIIDAKKGEQVDHKNCDSLDNRRGNLRIVTNSQNAMNRGKQRNNKSGYKGVHWDATRGKWAAQIKKKGKRTTIGRFDTAIEAARAYDEVSKEWHGEFGRTNF